MGFFRSERVIIAQKKVSSLQSKIKHLVFRRLVSYFFQGILLTAPLFATVYVIWSSFDFIDTNVNDILEKLTGVRMPFLGILVMLIAITLVGFIGSTIILRPIIYIMEEVLEHTPVVKTIYTSLKDFFSAFVSNKKRFTNPVLVEMGKNSGVFRLGFITRQDLTDLHLSEMVAVYMPHSYNFSGNLYVVKKEQVTSIQGIDRTDLMKFIVTGGITELDEEEK